MAEDNLREGNAAHMPVRTLWSDEAKTRQFLIPDTTRLPPGDFTLRTATGRRVAVDPEAVRAFEVTPEQARAWLKDQFAGLAKDVRSAFGEAWRRWRGSASPHEEAKAGADSSRAAAGGLPGAIELLAALTETSPHRLRDDPSALRGAFEALSQDVAAIFSGTTSSEPERLAAARDRIRELRVRLANRGIATSDALEELPARLQARFRSAGAKTDPRSNAAQIEAFADGLTAVADHLASSLRQLAAQLRKRAGDDSKANPQTGPTTGEPPTDG